MKKSKGNHQITGDAAGEQAAQTAAEAEAAVPASPGDGELAEVEESAAARLQDALTAKEKDFDALSDKYLRLAAEFDNFRRRSQKEKEALYADSIVAVVKELLPVFDNLERAELSAANYTNEDAKKIADGISKIQRLVEQSLARLGVSKIDCVGKPFNPDLHEAVMHIEDDSVGNSIVVAELQPGYQRDDRVIRHSMVKVAN